MIIRDYTPADREAVIALHEELQSYERDIRPTRAAGRQISVQQVDEYEATMADVEDARLLIAEREGVPVGFTFFLAEAEMLEDPQAQIYVQDFMVTASARRSGIGRALMVEIRRFMAERGIGLIDLQVLTGNNAALAFYRAEGFDVAYMGLQATTRQPD
ncbi:GNAT family N-acetyltransferase [Pontivivens ytuae]|uniref:GNAT family N-acetyltransferase n=1 Tax=Pontivivens ytuae TaxID=2789856 RepID=A0A7S9QBV9_9RHOB|nr:GNAT family N-acetyltransferase [Pontivivens ytuae]QPH52431.1 GNAT family N-acetyltransferase [Pontivivens ytuae]